MTARGSAFSEGIQNWQPLCFVISVFLYQIDFKWTASHKNKNISAVPSLIQMYSFLAIKAKHCYELFMVQTKMTWSVVIMCIFGIWRIYTESIVLNHKEIITEMNESAWWKLFLCSEETWLSLCTHINIIYTKRQFFNTLHYMILMMIRSTGPQTEWGEWSVMPNTVPPSFQQNV